MWLDYPYGVAVVRIASLSPAVTETLVLLGLEDEIVGITPWCRMYLNDVSKEIVGTYLTILFDRLEKVRPDVVFLQSRVHDKMLETVRSRGFDAYLMPLPTNVYSIIAHIVVDVGSIVGRYYEARELGERLLTRVLSISERTKDLKRLRVYVEYLWPDKTFSSTGALTFVDDGIRIAGGENIFKDVRQEFFYPSNEEIIVRDPEVILVNIEPPFDKLITTVEEYKMIRKPLENSKAFRENKVLLVKESREVNLAHFGPSFIDTVEWLSTEFEKLR
uniref:Fe/B12 periplasmic-binding domain-containing protein n=1 Tax=Ignisphaera aggregans TaxID=334771 RepID=A0A7C4BB63_9CREN